MGPRRYVAQNPADALKQIRLELGPEAVVLSNREVDDGVEIVAIRPEDLASMSGVRSVVAPNSEGAPFAALPMPASPRASSEAPPAARGRGSSAEGSRGGAGARPASTRTRAAGAETAPIASGAATRPRAPGSSVMARQRRLEEDQPANRPLGSGVNHELVIANVSQRSDRDRRRNPVYPPAESPRARKSLGEREANLDTEESPLARPAAASFEHAPNAAPTPQHAPALATRASAPDPWQNQSVPGNEAQTLEFARDLAEVKRLLQTHVAHSVAAAMTTDTPVRAELLKQMFSAGFSAGLASSLVAEMPEQPHLPAAVLWMQERLKADLRTLDVVGSIDDGGVYAFIGPTGVGKTTMVAKLAARCVLRFGRSRVALLTTDTYRIGAQEQLKVFAKILGLTITSVRDGADLAHKLEELSRKHVVLLDTAGMGQRDQLMIEQLSLLAEGRQHLKRILVVSATTGLHTLDDIYETYRQALGQEPFWGVVLTKLDEAVSLAPMVECVIRHQLPVLFMANGQRVPEDLHVPNTGYLVHRSLRVKATIMGSTPLDEHIPTLIADNLDAWARK